MSKRRRSAPAGLNRPARPSPVTAIGPTASAPETISPAPGRTPPPRPTKAARAEAGRRAQRRRSSLRIALLVGGFALSIAAIAVASGVGQPDVGEAAPLEGGVGQHLPEGSTLLQRNRPPSSGPHDANRAAYGSSSSPVAPGAWIHALEHGGIAVLFKCGTQPECDSTARQLGDEVYAKARDGAFGERKVVVTPYQDMDSPFAAVAWGRVLRLDHIDAAQILAFYDRYLDRGPERAR